MMPPGHKKPPNVFQITVSTRMAEFRGKCPELGEPGRVCFMNRRTPLSPPKERRLCLLRAAPC